MSSTLKSKACLGLCLIAALWTAPAAAESIISATGNAAATVSNATNATDASTPVTWDVVASHSNLSVGLADGESLSFRAAWQLSEGNNLQAEVLDERKFGAHGGVAALAYTRVLSPDWFGTGTLVFGHGGPNWANARGDLQLSRKWLAQRQLVTSVAATYAVFDNQRSDSGLRLSAAWYLELPAVLEAGVLFNRSQPGSITSQMPFVSATLGSQGQQYLSLRASSGTEAYQALGAAAQLVNFRSHSVAATWRRWIAPQWGFTAQAEQYNNPTYQRNSLGLGLFAKW
jgi:YaiO family outer membrane protein